MKRGIRASQYYYGGRLDYKVRAHVREGEWRQGVRNVVVLVRYHSRVFARALRKLASCTLARYRLLTL